MTRRRGSSALPHQDKPGAKTPELVPLSTARVFDVQGWRAQRSHIESRGAAAGAPYAASVAVPSAAPRAAPPEPLQQDRGSVVTL